MPQDRHSTPPNTRCASRDEFLSALAPASPQSPPAHNAASPPLPLHQSHKGTPPLAHVSLHIPPAVAGAPLHPASSVEHPSHPRSMNLTRRHWPLIAAQ